MKRLLFVFLDLFEKIRSWGKKKISKMKKTPNVGVEYSSSERNSVRPAPYLLKFLFVILISRRRRGGLIHREQPTLAPL
jgi:hypothetical protein